MALAKRSSKAKQATMKKSLPRASVIAILESARARRQRVLYPVKRDPLLAAVSPRRTSRGRDIMKPRADSARVSGTDTGPSTATVSSENHILNDVCAGVMENVLLIQRTPERLQRPELHEVTLEAILEAGHDMGMLSTELEGIRKELARNGESLYSTIKNARATVNMDFSGELPKFATVYTPAGTPLEQMPTHVLGVYSQDTDDKKRKMILTPVHAPVIAAHCCRVPPLPIPRPPSPTFATLDLNRSYQGRVVPLVPFAIPAANTFDICLELLCTQDTEKLFRTLVPIGPSSGGMWAGDFSRLSEVLANSFTGASLVSNLMKVYRVWQNACSLGVLNPAVWQVIDVAWKAHREALLLARR